MYRTALNGQLHKIHIYTADFFQVQLNMIYCLYCCILQFLFYNDRSICFHILLAYYQLSIYHPTPWKQNIRRSVTRKTFQDRRAFDLINDCHTKRSGKKLYINKKRLPKGRRLLIMLRLGGKKADLNGEFFIE